MFYAGMRRFQLTNLLDCCGASHAKGRARSCRRSRADGKTTSKCNHEQPTRHFRMASGPLLAVALGNP